MGKTYRRDSDFQKRKPERKPRDWKDWPKKDQREKNPPPKQKNRFTFDFD